MNALHHKNGYAGSIADVNLSTGSVTITPTPEALKRDYIGGNGFAVRLAYDCIPPGTDPLSADNVLIFAVGPVAGTLAPCNSRFVVATRSPLTGFFVDSYVGGAFGEELKNAGFDALVVRGQAQRPVVLVLDDQQITVREADELWGQRTFATQKALKQRLGEDFQVATIGPAGEHLVAFAAIIAGTRAAGRGGCGAVMGAKRLKAIAVRGSRATLPADSVGLWTFFEECVKRFKAHPGTGGVLPTIGTGAGVNAFNRLGMLPSFNWQSETFAAAHAISGDRLREGGYYTRSKACTGCIIRCSKIARTQNAAVPTITEGPEYETLYSLGSLVGNDNLDAIIAGDRLCDELGLDTISAGVVTAFAMECFEKGLLPAEKAAGLSIRFGDHEGLLRLLEDLAVRRGLGELLCDGVQVAASRVGQGSEAFAMHVKGMELVGHSSRGLKGMTLGYAVSNRGGTHQDTRPTVERGGLSDPTSVEGKGVMNVRSQNATTLGDSMILCRYTEGVFGVFIGEDHARLLRLVTGVPRTVQELETVAERIYTLERLFNVREGASRAGDTLPARLLTESIPSGPVKGRGATREELEVMLDQYYAARHWSRDGIPTAQTCARLGL